MGCKNGFGRTTSQTHLRPRRLVAYQSTRGLLARYGIPKADVVTSNVFLSLCRHRVEVRNRTRRNRVRRRPDHRHAAEDAKCWGSLHAARSILSLPHSTNCGRDRLIGLFALFAALSVARGSRSLPLGCPGRMEYSSGSEFCLGLVVDWGHRDLRTCGLRQHSQFRKSERKVLRPEVHCSAPRGKERHPQRTFGSRRPRPAVKATIKGG